MKRIFLVAAFVLLLFASCSTTITVPYLQPSIIDMGAHRNLAVASVVPYKGYAAPSRFVIGADVHAAGLTIYSGYSSSTSGSVAAYATDQLYSILSSSGFFNILQPDRTDMIIERGKYGYDISSEFRRLGYDAVLIPRITGMSVNETIYSKPYEEWWFDEDGDRHSYIEYNYYYKQIASIDYSLTIIDTESGNIIGQRMYSDTKSREGILDRSWSRLDDVSYLFRSMIRSFNADIIHLLVPTTREYSVSLMSNKPENKEADSAYEAAKNGDYATAERIFISEWKDNKHLPSGYNAALLMASRGNYDGAIDLLTEVTSAYYNADARSLYRDLLSIRSRNEQAMGQVEGTSSVSSHMDARGNGIYALVMGS